jgi:Uncharacterized protein conserved in bacteria (DUF2188)
MRTKADVHTVHDCSGFWVNKTSGTPVGQHHTKAIAVRRGRQIARKRRTEHAIHSVNGEIGCKNSYGIDPRPPVAEVEKNR